MKTYDIKPSGLVSSVINLKKETEKVFSLGKKVEKAAKISQAIQITKRITPEIQDKKDVFKEKFFRSLKTRTVSFKKENLFNEKTFFEKKTVKIDKKTDLRTCFLAGVADTHNLRNQKVGMGVKLKKFSLKKELSQLKPAPFPSWFQPLFRFSLVLVLLSLFFPLGGFIEKGLRIKEKVMAEAEEGYSYLLKAKESAEKSNFESTKESFESAASSFRDASSLSAEIGRVFFYIFKYSPFGNKISSGINLLEAGEKISKAGEFFLDGLSPFLEKRTASYFEGGEKTEFLTDEMEKSREKIKAARKEIEEAEESLSKIQITDLPEDIQGKATELKNKLPAIKEGTDMALDYLDAFLMILGGKESKKYLFVFQNNREARATGGFIGSYGVIDVDRGRVKKIFVDDIYNPDGQLFEKIIPPRPIQKIDDSWHMRDSNWFSDFPLSAEKISWFYEKTGGPTVDGIIAMTPTVIEKLLGLTGPISMPEYGITIDSNNFVEATQYEVEFDYNKEENKPKKILTDLAPVILDRIFSLPGEKWPEVLNILSESLREKHILLYFRDSSAEDFAKKYNFGGEVKETEGDFLMVVNSNIGGHKTDFLMENKINHQVEVMGDGKIIDEVTITRKHQGGGENDFDLPEAENWYKKTNYNYLRVLVPKGATLLEASGFVRESDVPGYVTEQDFANYKRDEDVVKLENSLKEFIPGSVFTGEEAGKTVFSGFVVTPPLEESKVVLKYELPFKIELDGLFKEASSYSFLLEKQGGSKESQFESAILLPDKNEVKWFYGDGVDISGNKINIKNTFNQDKYFGFVFGKK